MDALFAGSRVSTAPMVRAKHRALATRLRPTQRRLALVAQLLSRVVLFTHYACIVAFTRSHAILNRAVLVGGVLILGGRILLKHVRSARSLLLSCGNACEVLCCGCGGRVLLLNHRG